LAELEAESTAYVVCQSLGLETGAYSFGYVATWAGGGEQAVRSIKACCERVQATATRIVRDVEELGSVPPSDAERLLLVGGALGHPLLDGVHDGRIKECGHVAQGSVIGHISKEAAHDLATPGLG